jgi:hypothetical protein
MQLIIPANASGAGNAGCSIVFAGQKAGMLTCLMHQECGQHFWVRPNRLKIAAVWDTADAQVIDLMLSYGNSDKPIAQVDEATGQAAKPQARPHRYQAGWRLRVLKRPVKTPFLTSRCLWVENTDTEPWHLVDVFHWIAPAIGGNREADTPDGPDVPNYYMAARGWVDQGAGIGLGVTYPPGSGYRCHYWRNKGGGIHSDLYFPVNERLKPGDHYEPTARPVFVFGYKATTPQSLSAGARGIWEVLRASGE